MENEIGTKLVIVLLYYKLNKWYYANQLNMWNYAYKIPTKEVILC